MSCNKLCEKLSVKKFSRNIDLKKLVDMGFLEKGVYKSLKVNELAD
jgi:hypothetical protein